MGERWLRHLMQWNIANPRSGQGIRTAQFAAVGFDVAIQEVLATLASARTLVDIDDDQRRNPRLLLDTLDLYHVQRLFLPTPALQVLATEAAANGGGSSLRDVICAGDQLAVVMERLGCSSRCCPRPQPRRIRRRLRSRGPRPRRRHPHGCGPRPAAGSTGHRRKNGGHAPPLGDGGDIGLTGEPIQGTLILTAFMNNPPILVSGVLSFDALNFEPIGVDKPEAFNTATVDATYRALALRHSITSTTTGPPRTWLLTRNSVATSETETPSPAQAGIAALARSAVREFLDLPYFRVDLPPEPSGPDDAAAAAAMLTEIARCDEADVAHRSGQRYVRRIVPYTSVPKRNQSLAPGSYMITGGFSSLGTLTAAELIRRGADRVVLIGRADDGADRRDRTREELVQLLGSPSDLDSHIDFDYADVAQPEYVSALIHCNHLPSAPLRGVVHAAGTLTDKTLHNQTRESITAAFSAIVAGAVHLHLALQSHGDLEVIACFTSATGALGNPRQANYVAANAIVEYLMETRAQQQLAGQCITWGPWAEVGHLSERLDVLHELAQSGIGALTTQVGTDPLEKVMGNDSGTVAVLANDWASWRAGSNEVEETSFRDLIPATSEPTEDTNQHAALHEILQTLENNKVNRALELTRAGVRKTAEKVLGGVVDPESLLRDAGLDSLSAVQLRNGPVQYLEIALTINVCLSHVSADALANHLVELLATETSNATVSVGLP